MGGHPGWRRSSLPLRASALGWPPPTWADSWKACLPEAAANGLASGLSAVWHCSVAAVLGEVRMNSTAWHPVLAGDGQRRLWPWAGYGGQWQVGVICRGTLQPRIRQFHTGYSRWPHLTEAADKGVSKGQFRAWHDVPKRAASIPNGFPHCRYTSGSIQCPVSSNRKLVPNSCRKWSP